MDEPPIRAAIKFPERIYAEWTLNYQSGAHELWLHFMGSDGSDLTTILSVEQAQAMARLEADDPQRIARDLYVAGHIDVGEFERRLDRDYRRPACWDKQTRNGPHKATR